jgi:hypothetical protein
VQENQNPNQKKYETHTHTHTRRGWRGERETKPSQFIPFHIRKNTTRKYTENYTFVPKKTPSKQTKSCLPDKQNHRKEEVETGYLQRMGGKGVKKERTDSHEMSGRRYNSFLSVLL